MDRENTSNDDFIVYLTDPRAVAEPAYLYFAKREGYNSFRRESRARPGGDREAVRVGVSADSWSFAPSFHGRRELPSAFREMGLEPMATSRLGRALSAARARVVRRWRSGSLSTKCPAQAGETLT